MIQELWQDTVKNKKGDQTMALNTLTKQSAYDEIRNYIVSNNTSLNLLHMIYSFYIFACHTC